MNKKLLTLAVGAVLTAGTSIAQADTTVYGHFHLSMDNIDNDAVSQSYMASNLSYFGIRGNEDLSGGMKAIYQIESGAFNVDEGDGGLGVALRNTFIGLSGAWGATKFGRHDTPTKDMFRKIERFNDQVGDMRNVVGNKGGFDTRADNMVRYESPKILGGLTFNALYTGNSGNEDTAASEKIASANVLWESGPILAGGSYEQRGVAGAGDDPTIYRLIGRWDFGVGDVGGLWETAESIGGASGADRDSYGIFGSWKFGQFRLKAQYIVADELDNAANTGGELMAIGLDYALGKKTKVYINYAATSNDSGANFTVASSSGAGHGDTLAAPANGADATGWSVGMIIDF